MTATLTHSLQFAPARNGRPPGPRLAPPARRPLPRPQTASAATQAMDARRGRTGVRFVVAAALVALAALSCHEAGVIAAMPSPARTQSLVGATELSGYVDDGRPENSFTASDTASPAYAIDPRTYAMTPVRRAQEAGTAQRENLRWTSRWPTAWTPWSGFVEAVVASGFLTIGGLVLASTLDEGNGSDDETVRPTN